MSARDPAFPLTAPLRDLAAWTQALRDLEIPVLADTAATLETLRANEDAVDANLLGEVIAADPLMTLKVLAYAASHRSARMVTDTDTVTSALVMMGISPFFRAFGVQPTVEDRLNAVPAALDGLWQVLARARRAARFGLAFAVHRMDHHAASVHQAALLHDFADMLLWCHAPTLALRINDLQQADPALRSRHVQQTVLNIELPDLQHALMRAWHFPELLMHISDDRYAEHARRGAAINPHTVSSVLLAVRLARHTVHGWDDTALPDDLQAIGELLNLSPPATLAFVQEVDG